MKDILMPDVGEGVTEATLVSWLIAPGETFATGDVLIEVMTDKVSMEIEAEENGTLLEILVPADEEVRIGALLGRYNQA